MDYKALIERLRQESQSWAAYNSSELTDVIDAAASALETLLAERDALMGQVRGNCSCCANIEKCMYEYMRGKRTMRDCAENNRRNWQWRGLVARKEGTT